MRCGASEGPGGSEPPLPPERSVLRSTTGPAGGGSGGAEQADGVTGGELGARTESDASPGRAGGTALLAGSAGTSSRGDGFPGPAVHAGGIQHWPEILLEAKRQGHTLGLSHPWPGNYRMWRKVAHRFPRFSEEICFLRRLWQFFSQFYREKKQMADI